MDIQEMHDAFRTIGQQIGTQLNRGILPESIDVYLNNAINEKVQTELLTGVRTALQEGVNTQAMTMSPINAFRTLYKTERLALAQPTISAPNIYESKDADIVDVWNPVNGFHVINLPIKGSAVAKKYLEDSHQPSETSYGISPMMYLGFSVEYDNTYRGNAVACRLIGSDVLETTLRDFCNGASKDSPIVCLGSSNDVFRNLYTYKDAVTTNDMSNEQLEIYTNKQNCFVKYLNIKYIKTPNVVKFDMNKANCVNCDLPEYTHFGIVEAAVRKFYQSVGVGYGSDQSSQRRRSDD